MPTLLRTLLIDNYDSFTFNLFQLIARVNGAPPLVMRNDDPMPPDWDALEVDNIVISPGPGRPDRPADFGICRAAILDSGLPLLGVCLGHQGIGHAFGGRVRHAVEPMHGRASAVFHDGAELFAGIPSPFQAIRYHSLVVDPDLPDALEATAWTADGVVMGLRHRRAPIWGVQFHPESIGSEHGASLLRNFRALSERHRPERRDGAVGGKPISLPPLDSNSPTPQVSSLKSSCAGLTRVSTRRRRGQYRAVFAGGWAWMRGSSPRTTSNVDKSETSESGGPRGEGFVHPSARVTSGNPLKLTARRITAAAAPEEVFAALFAGSETAFWLDSALIKVGLSRFSFMGDASDSQILTYFSRDRRIVIGEGGRERTLSGDLFDHLRAELDVAVEADAALPFDFRGGYVGYLGYELKPECGADAAHDSTLPDAMLIKAERFLAFDHEEHQLYVVAMAERGDPAARAWLDAMEQRLLDIPRAAPIPSIGAEGPVIFTLRDDHARYRESIRAAQALIRDGESYEICLTNLLTTPFAGDPFALYRILRATNPAPFAAYLKFGDVAILSSSPERFLKIDLSGLIEAKPIKGTIRRSSDTAEDSRLAETLRNDDKNRAENLMIVDLLRNDLGRVAEIGSVRVRALMAVESYATVHQLVSTIEAQLRPDRDAVDCVKAAFPGGSMTGAPKIRTMQIIDRLEGAARGVYSGAIGYLGYGGAVDLSIVIRTIVAADGALSMGIGGAIVSLSDPESEFAEILLKAEALIRAVVIAQTGGYAADRFQVVGAAQPGG